MTTIYILYHIDQKTDEDDDQEKLIGAYSTQARAEQAISRLKDKPGFRDYPERWFIAERPLDKDNEWTTGFVTMYPGDEPWNEVN